MTCVAKKQLSGSASGHPWTRQIPEQLVLARKLAATH